MQRHELSRQIIRKFEKDVYKLYKSAWKQIDDLYDDEYEQNLSVPWFTILSNEYNFGFKRNKLEDIYDRRDNQSR